MVNLYVYIIHTKSLAVRKTMCEKLKNTLTNGPWKNVTFKYITQFDPDDVAKMNPQSLIDLSQISADVINADIADELNKQLKPLTLQYLSNTLKHCAAIKSIMSNSSSTDEDYHIVLEDDVMFNEGNVNSRLHNAISQRPVDCDIMFLGFPYVKMSENDNEPESLTCRPLMSVYKQLPGCDSYFITKKAASVLGQAFLPVKFPAHCQFTYLLQKLPLKSYTSTPNPFVEGSKLGSYVSSLNTNNLLIYNPTFRELFNIVHNNSQYTEQHAQAFNELWSQTPFKSHPDFLYVKGMFLLKLQQFKEAKLIMDEVFNLYKKNNCELTKDSVFLNNYIELFKVCQMP